MSQKEEAFLRNRVNELISPNRQSLFVFGATEEVIWYYRANLIDKNTNVLKDARIAAQNAESRYSRVSSTRQPKIGDINNE